MILHLVLLKLYNRKYINIDIQNIFTYLDFPLQHREILVNKNIMTIGDLV